MHKKDSESVLNYSLEQLIAEAQNSRFNVNWHIYNIKENTSQPLFDIGKAYYSARWYYTAMAWFIKASERGHAEAHRKIGVMYQHGYGVDYDDEMALECYHRSVYYGSKRANKNIHYLYMCGTSFDRATVGRIKSEERKLERIREAELEKNKLLQQQKTELENLEEEKSRIIEHNKTDMTNHEQENTELKNQLDAALDVKLKYQKNNLLLVLFVIALVFFIFISRN